MTFDRLWLVDVGVDVPDAEIEFRFPNSVSVILIAMLLPEADGACDRCVSGRGDSRGFDSAIGVLGTDMSRCFRGAKGQPDRVSRGFA